MSPKGIDVTPAELRGWLESGKKVSVLDVRPTAEREEWSIPGSLHVDAYRKLREEDPQALSGVDLPTDRPVVAVCAKGNTSKLAQARLSADGYKAYSLVGGMKAWSLAWNRAEVPLTDAGDAVVLQFR
jgi:rhodanese-related sulfurtransferase